MDGIQDFLFVWNFFIMGKIRHFWNYVCVYISFSMKSKACKATASVEWTGVDVINYCEGGVEVKCNIYFHLSTYLILLCLAWHPWIFEIMPFLYFLVWRMSILAYKHWLFKPIYKWNLLGKNFVKHLRLKGLKMRYG